MRKHVSAVTIIAGESTRRSRRDSAIRAATTVRRRDVVNVLGIGKRTVMVELTDGDMREIPRKLAYHWQLIS